ncbi:hypothetical protein MNEG_14526 [Monoraphidium neglectum]|uniref:Uncharacterized protein n=1 Tax=Monoraphidium neglectum TaxID=145388 RepID=A0A0D2J023_9CHLO|nr:hypothetical protein MNEG_14526 [Monoraphidium neglectum]KIY93437.1 hypothetical protein MNEG_14526 [Monoraphidium neglectum]|eukprot:XP_013892457.1 hypothetical protein MNEG_14526 [Monoraphidium neglectum]
MMEDLSLSAEQARAIAAMIRREVGRVAAGGGDEGGAAEEDSGAAPPPEPPAGAAAAAALAAPPAPLPSLSRSGHAGHQQQQQQPDGAARSGPMTPTAMASTPGRPPSYHELARVMREFHEQQQLEEAAAAHRQVQGGTAAKGQEQAPRNGDYLQQRPQEQQQ